MIAREDNPGDKRLVAYIITDESISSLSLRRYLKSLLPDYMVPSKFVNLDSLPLTPNGKIDRKALPAPDSTGLEEGYVAPSTPTQEILAEIWCEVLQVDKVGIYDNFFDLGGHSFLFIKVASMTEKRMNIEVPLRELFNQTLGQSAA